MKKEESPNITAHQIAEEAIGKLNKRITNEVFLTIQNDRELMHKYLRAVQYYGLDYVNQTIGKVVKESYALVNVNERENNPSCTLIESHQKFE
ncbi:hypothetical protein [Alistipes sp. ZOR0009]|uniref:hypothetical protein n=1 Tax=Alistipes sp. ZOR0009 TaxID=1339253 RepID=UPI00064732AA|nr:hypothetical protein [Alistipes sp. ZOR0009]